MQNYDRRLDIPARALINGELLRIMEAGKTFYAAKEELFKSERYAQQLSEHVDNYRMSDQSFTLSLLYCTIVVPREFLNLSRDHALFRELDTDGSLTCFQCSPVLDAYTFLHCLRNSVSHALYSVEDRDTGVFYHFRTERKPKLDSATIEQQDLLNFVASVGRRLANAVLMVKATRPSIE